MYSPSEVAKVNNYATVVGEDKILRVYPYELVNANHDETFIKPNATVIPYMKNDYEKDFENSVLEKDTFGNYYFDVWFDPTKTTVLDSTSHTSVYGQEIKEEISILARSNWMYQKSGANIQLGNGATILPAFFTIGRPFVFDDYVSGKQDVFFTPEITTIKEQYGGELQVADAEGDYEFQLVNIKNIEASTQNFRIIPQTFKDFDSLDQSNNNLRLGFENHTLIGDIKLRGREEIGNVTELPIDLDNVGLVNNGYLNGLFFLESDINGLNLQPENIFRISLTYNTAGTNNVDVTEIEEIKWGAANKFNVIANGAEYPTGLQGQRIVRLLNHTSYLLTFLKKDKVKDLKIEVIKTANLNAESEVGYINLQTTTPLMPFKFTPIENDDNMEMFADWFDYDVVMPYFMVDHFNTDGTSKKFTISDVVDVKDNGDKTTNPEDAMLIQDMLTISAAFADSFARSKMIDATHYDPNEKFGNEGISISNIVGKDAIKVVDGLYESHIRKHPTFRASKERQQRVRATICALSRFIYSSYAIGKGQNDYHQMYLPWFFEPAADATGTLDYYVKIGATGNNGINANTQFVAKSIYFNEEFSQTEIQRATSEFKLPTKLRFGKTIDFESDRKISLPKIPEIMGTMDKMPLPGDINTAQSGPLSYIWYLPVTSVEEMKNIMLKDTGGTTTIPAGAIKDVYLPPTASGVILSEDEIRAKVNAIVPGGEIQGTLANSIIKLWRPAGTGSYIQQHNAGNISYNGKNKNWVGIDTVLETWLATVVADLEGLKHEAVRVDGTPQREGESHIFNVSLAHQEFTAIQVKVPKPTIIKLSYTDRRVTFDKEGWRKFLNEVGIQNNLEKIYEFAPLDGDVITKMNEVVIKTMWGNWVDVYYGDARLAKRIRIPLFNEDDETVTKQRIIFS